MIKQIIKLRVNYNLIIKNVYKIGKVIKKDGVNLNIMV